MSEIREVVYKGVRIEVEQIKSLLTQAVSQGLISQKEMDMIGGVRIVKKVKEN